MFPDDWKCARVIPLFKQGELYDLRVDHFTFDGGGGGGGGLGDFEKKISCPHICIRKNFLHMTTGKKINHTRSVN